MWLTFQDLIIPTSQFWSKQSQGKTLWQAGKQGEVTTMRERQHHGNLLWAVKGGGPGRGSGPGTLCFLKSTCLPCIAAERSQHKGQKQ